MENDERQVAVSFAAIDPIVDRLIVTPKERKVAGRDWIEWGDRNKYPEYLCDLYANTPTLRSVINGYVDFIVGDEVLGAVGMPPKVFDGLRDIVRRTAKSVAISGGWKWQVIRNMGGGIEDIVVMPFKSVRTDKENEQFWYSENWDKARVDLLVYPKFVPEFKQDASIHNVKLWGDGVYSEPLYAASIKACETERSIDEFHLGNIERGFMGSYLVNFSNGVPEDKQKKEIERDFNAKFAGKKNAGRIMFSYSRDKEHAATLQKMEIADYGEKYETLSKHCRQQIFTAFRANPNLFGIPTESLGFSSEEYESSFKLFNRTMVQPVQKAIVVAFDYVLGMRDSVQIVPFSIEDRGEDAVGADNGNREE